MEDSPRRIIIGIDPGKNGGIAYIKSTGAAAIKMPDTEKDVYSALAEIVPSALAFNPFAYIEKVASSPQMGVRSAFTFGRGYGLLLGCLYALDISFEEIPPMRWQKALGCLSHGDKNVTKTKAQQLFPHLNITHSIADALLIAEYGRRINQTPP